MNSSHLRKSGEEPSWWDFKGNNWSGRNKAHITQISDKVLENIRELFQQKLAGLNADSLMLVWKKTNLFWTYVFLVQSRNLSEKFWDMVNMNQGTTQCSLRMIDFLKIANQKLDALFSRFWIPLRSSQWKKLHGTSAHLNMWWLSGSKF